MSEQFAIEMRGITKSFGPVMANKGINLQVRPGEILPCWARTAPARPP